LELQQASETVELFPSRESPAFPISWKLSKLTSLRLTRTPLYPAITGVTSLVDLKLDGYTTPFQFPEFIAFLGANPNLQFIVLDVQFERPPSGFGEVVALPHLRRLSLTCADPLDAKLLISCISLPRGVSLEIAGSSANRCTALRSFLPSPPTGIEEMLTPIVTIKYQRDPGMVQFYGNDSSLSFRPASYAPGSYPELSLFPATTVRELHLENDRYRDPALLLSQLPALETLVLVNVDPPQPLFACLMAEPVLCPSLKTIAFFDRDVYSEVIEKLEAVVIRRKKSTAAWLYRIIIVGQTLHFLDHDLVLRLRKSVPCVDVRVDDKIPDLS
jgi:hypothetical protein